MTEEEIAALAGRVLMAHGMAPPQAAAIAGAMAAAERDACPAHGLYRLAGTVRTIRAGLVGLDAVPVLEPRAGGILIADARRTFAPYAFNLARPRLADMARRQGLAALAIRNCFHLTALWPEVEPLAEEGLVALAMTPSQSFVAPAGGTRPLLGTNPIAFGWPRPGGHPFVFDFATSVAARGEIDLLRRAGRQTPEGWGVGPDGEPSTDPAAILAGAMSTFGGHKGSALAIMVELLAAAMIGDLTSAEARELDGGVELAPLHGELVIVIDPQTFAESGRTGFVERAEQLFASIVAQGARLPSERRYAARERHRETGIPIGTSLLEEVEALLPDPVSSK